MGDCECFKLYVGDCSRDRCRWVRVGVGDTGG